MHYTVAFITWLPTRKLIVNEFVTHPREPLEMQGGTTFHFVTDGIHSALEQAKKAARRYRLKR